MSTHDASATPSTHRDSIAVPRSSALPPQVMVLLTWAGLLIGIAATVTHIKITDFPVDMAVYRAGVRAFLAGTDMYSIPMHVGDLNLPFIYPPFGALIMVPLTAPGWITDSLAGDIFIVLSNALVLACLLAVFRAILPDHDRRTVWALSAISWAFALHIEPVTLNNGFAQINILIMALVVFDLVPRPRRWLPQGALIGIAAAIKLTPLAFGLYFLLRKDIRAIVVTAISACACTALAALWRFDATVDFYFSTLLGMGTSAEIGVDTTYQSNSSIKGLLMRWATSDDALEQYSTLINIAWLLLVIFTIVAGAMLMLALLRRQLRVEAVMINAIIMLLVSPVSWSHHWVWLAVIIPLFAWRAATTLPRPRPLGTVVAIWSLLIVTVPPKWWFGDSIDIWALPWWKTLLVSDFVWLAGAFLIAVTVSLRAMSTPQSAPAAAPR